MEKVVTVAARLSPSNFPSIVIVRDDGWVCLDYVGERVAGVTPKANAVMLFSDIAIARKFLAYVSEVGDTERFALKQLSWEEWLQLAAKSLREGLTYYSTVVQVGPTMTKATMEFADIVEMAWKVGGQTTDGQHGSKV